MSDKNFESAKRLYSEVQARIGWEDEWQDLSPLIRRLWCNLDATGIRADDIEKFLKSLPPKG